MEVQFRNQFYEIAISGDKKQLLQFLPRLEQALGTDNLAMTFKNENTNIRTYLIGQTLVTLVFIKDNKAPLIRVSMTGQDNHPLTERITASYTTFPKLEVMVQDYSKTH